MNTEEDLFSQILGRNGEREYISRNIAFVLVIFSSLWIGNLKFEQKFLDFDDSRKRKVQIREDEGEKFLPIKIWILELTENKEIHFRVPIPKGIGNPVFFQKGMVIP